MASSPAPKTKLPETKVEARDVKQDPAPSGKEAKVEASASKESEVELDENDLASISEGQKVPYDRFKAKNDEAKQLKAELARREEHYKAELQRALIEKEAALTASRRAPASDVIEIQDPVERQTKSLQGAVEALRQELASLKGESSNQRLQSQIEKLQTKYPEADTLAVLGWKKHDPSLDLEEAMELSHTRTVEKTQKSIQKILEAKKSKKAGPVLSEGGFKLSDNEKPKSVKEANALLKNLFGRG